MIYGFLSYNSKALKISFLLYVSYSMTEQKKLSNHHHKVALEKKQKMKSHLMLSALDLYCQSSPEKVLVIDDFVKYAGVSRGTFYNYFLSTNELLTEISMNMSDEVLEIIEPIIAVLNHPIERVTIATRLYLRSAMHYPVWGRLITSVGPRYVVRDRNVAKFLTRDLKKADELGHIKIEDYRVTRDMFLGSVYYSLETMLTETVDQHYLGLVIKTLLGHLGIQQNEVQRLYQLELPSEIEITTPFFTILKQHQSKGYDHKN